MLRSWTARHAACSFKAASVAPGCVVPGAGPPDCLRKLRQTGYAASLQRCPLRCRLRGSSGRLSAAQPTASPHGAIVSRPRVSFASFDVLRHLPNQVRWSAVQHNGQLCATLRCALCRAACARITLIMCKSPPGLLRKPPPAQRVAARGASAAARLALPVLAPRYPAAPKGLPL